MITCSFSVFLHTPTHPRMTTPPPCEWWESNTSSTSLRDDSGTKKIVLECVGGLELKVEEKLRMLTEAKDTRRLSYDEATRGIRKIASALLTVFKVKENDIVALGVHENVQLVLIVLGIVKSRCAFVPIDPSNPEARIRSLLEEAKPTYVLSQHFNYFKIFESKTHSSTDYVL